MKIIASGTFDHLHDGHKFFLDSAFENGYVLIGLSSDTLTEDKGAKENIEPYEVRKMHLLKWLSLNRRFEGVDFEIREITTPFGFACENEDFNAILVTEENEDIGQKINKKRALLGYEPLRILSCALISDKNGKISSTRIRKSLSS
ncbi:MAG: pantetheine-phosphate adenylyltransferase [Candidatus Methanofastidiosia archaeon]